MKKVRSILFLTALLISVIALSLTDAYAQNTDPIRWTVKKDNPSSPVKAGDKFNAQVIATIDDGWHLYSLEQPSGGPIPTRISIVENQNFKLAGKIESPLPQVVFDPNFNMDTQFYADEAVFDLSVEVAKDVLTGKNTLSVNIFFQTCNDKTCLPPKLVKVSTDIAIIEEKSTVNNSNKSSDVKSPDSQTGKTNSNSNTTAIDFDFIDFTGKSRKFSEFRGKVVLLDFWATWCAPCLADIPKLKKLYEKFKDKDFEIIGMDAETIGDEAEEPDPEFAKETQARARQIVSTRGVTWTQATSATAVPVATKIFNVKALPSKILIDKKGKIIATIGQKDDLIALVEKLLNTNK